jgi:hypothetical protein
MLPLLSCTSNRIHTGAILLEHQALAAATDVGDRDGRFFLRRFIIGHMLDLDHLLCAIIILNQLSLCGSRIMVSRLHNLMPGYLLRCYLDVLVEVRQRHYIRQVKG